MGTVPDGSEPSAEKGTVPGTLTPALSRQRRGRNAHGDSPRRFSEPHRPGPTAIRRWHFLVARPSRDARAPQPRSSGFVLDSRSYSRISPPPQLPSRDPTCAVSAQSVDVTRTRRAATWSRSEYRLRRRGQAHFAPRTPQKEPVPDGVREKGTVPAPSPWPSPRGRGSM